MKRVQHPVRNRLLDALPAGDLDLLVPHAEAYLLDAGNVLFEPGQEVIHVYFPGPGTIASLLLDLKEGVTTEAAMIGQEGAVGGIVSEGNKPAFARGTVQIAGPALRVPTAALEAAKQRSSDLRDHFARYADCLLAQVLQSVACNAVHELDARLARWLLTTHDRVGRRDLHLTHQFIAEMLGVQRSYATRIIGALEKKGIVEIGRGLVTIKDRRGLEGQACECYACLRRHYQRLLPGVYPVPE